MRFYIATICLLAVVTSPLTAFGDTESDSLYQANHPRLLFNRAELPALRAKVRGPGRDGDAYLYARHLMDDVFPGYNNDEMLSHSYGVGTFPTVCMMAWLESVPDTAAINLGRRLVDHTIAAYGPDDNVYYAPLRLRLLALGYDSFYQSATTQERAAVRAEMEAYVDTMLTTRQYEYWKYRPYLANISTMIASALGLAAICLDGETDPARVEAALSASYEYIDQWLEYQLDPGGSYKEGAMYAGWCMRNLCYYFWARKRFDGFDYSNEDRIRNMEIWVAYTLLPFGNAWVNNVGDATTLNYPWSRHHTYFDWAQWEWNSGLSAWLWEQILGPERGHDSGELADPTATMLWNRNLQPVEPDEVLLGRQLWADRGQYYFRTGWPRYSSASDDVVLSFYSGKFHGGHSQEDQNNFTLYGLQSRWVIDHGYGEPGRTSAAHNMVFIDGAGQHHSGGSVGTDGRIAEYLPGGLADYLMGDATAAYTTYSEFNRPGYPFPENDWSYGYKGANPVRYAHRRLLVVHGPDAPPYVILMDDVDKDGGAHDYEWRLHTDASNTVDVSQNPVRIGGVGGLMDIHVVGPAFETLTAATSRFDNGHEDPDATVISLSTTDDAAHFVLLMLMRDGNSPVLTPGIVDAPWGEAFVLQRADSTVDAFARNHSGEWIEFHSFATDAAMTLTRSVSRALTGFVITGATALEWEGFPWVTVSDGPLGVSYGAGEIHIDRRDAAFRIYAPGDVTVLYQGSPVRTRREGDYVVSAEYAAATVVGVTIAAYPNPFNAGTTVTVDLARAGHLTVEAFDAAGRRVRSLWEGEASFGEQVVEWDGLNDKGQPVASGVYLLRAVAQDGEASLKLVRIK